MLRSALLVVAGAIALMGFAFAAGRPLVYTDTRAYYALGEQVAALAHLAPSSPVAASLGEGADDAASSAARQRLAYTVAGSRSVYYSTWLFLLQRIGGLWFVTFVGSAVAAATLWTFARVTAGPHRLAAYAAGIGGLALLSSLPVYLAFVMPDVFAGLGIVAATMLVAFRRALTPSERVALAALLLLSCLFHTTHLLVALGLAGFAAAVAAVPGLARRDWWPGAAITGAVAAAALLLGMLYPLGVRLVRHETIYSAPFLTARVVADGPGRAYLRQACAQGERYALCAFADRPLDSSDDFLWKSYPGRAVFQAAGYDQRVAIIDEQPRFVLATIAHDPGGVAAAALRNVVALMGMWRTDEPLADPTPVFTDPKFAVFRRIVPGGAACAAGQRSCAPRVGPGVMNGAVGLGLLLGWIVILGLLATDAGLRRRFGPVAALWAAALVGNAVVCGVVSGPFMRYQSRLSWLIPLLAIVLICARLSSRRLSRPAGGPRPAVV